MPILSVHATENNYKVLLWNVWKYMDNANTIPPLKYHFNHIDGVTVIEKNSGMLTKSEIEDVFIEKTLFDPSKIIDKEEILKSIDERVMTIDDFLEEIDEK